MQLFSTDSGVTHARRQPSPAASDVRGSHTAHFYSDEATLLSEVGLRLANALRAGGSVVVIAEESNRRGVAQHLESMGIDVARLNNADRWMALDASAALAEFMVDGWPDEKRFNRLIAGILDRLTAAAATPLNPAPPIAAYGEMVTILWKRGQQAAAIRLEELWAVLNRDRAFHLSCGWPLNMFTTDRDALAVDRICSLHTELSPKVGSEPGEGKGRQRMSLLWQLKANKVLQRISRISRQTLGFYRDVSAPGWTDLQDALDEVLSIYDQRVRDGQIRIVRKIRPNLRIFAPLGEVKYILSKLVANAFDSSFHGSTIYIGARAARHPETGARGIRISVGDQGIGLDHALCAQVFSPFFGSRKDINVGLGLYAVREMIERRGGFIRCRSKVTAPSGTVMTAFLPLEPIALAADTTQTTAA